MQGKFAFPEIMNPGIHHMQLTTETPEVQSGKRPDNPNNQSEIRSSKISIIIHNNTELTLDHNYSSLPVDQTVNP